MKSSADRFDSVDKVPEALPASVESRMPVVFFPSPHFAVLSPEVFLNQCMLRTQRRSGPGGQHRNKTSSGVFLTHLPTGLVAEATERRSQADNRQMALQRLRYRLAVEVRTSSQLDAAAVPEEAELRQRFQGNLRRMCESNVDKPAVISLLLNDLHAAGGQPRLVASWWKSSTTVVVNLVRSIPTAFTMLNQIRHHHQRKPLC